ncbi:unnamed protein product [Prorocentrum cordatum]|uniref:Reverse transcriptase domain-containing protein n=1 Tax=Prorocentrum cordatum TaxID=2364126 RepID=A0ABN9TIX2_9DINO|nr:unnamed protein product [Polarella glacialis]
MCSSDDSAAILFDFTAAFPSIEHEFMPKVFQHLSWPHRLLRFIEVLYAFNTCELAMGGSWQQGFVILRGVRQSCPLSPLLFAVATDALLPRIMRKVPESTLRAHADDTALVHQNIWRVLPQIELIFSEFQSMSGLASNVDKTVFVPLSGENLESTRERLAQAAPLWGSMSVARCGKYLGYVIGPCRGVLSWDAPIGKFAKRARIWGGLGLKTTLACRAFILSTLLFVCLLDPLPQRALEAEESALKSLFREHPG